MLGFMNIVLVSPQKTLIIQVLYYFQNILKVIFIIKTSSTWFYVTLILQPLHSVMQQFSHAKFSYLPLKNKLVLIYWMMRILKSLMSLIKSQINQPVCLCRRKSYQSTENEEIRSIFDQVRPVISHLEFCLPEKPLTPNKICESLKGPQRQLWKEDLFLQYYKKNFILLLAPIPIKYLP